MKRITTVTLVLTALLVACGGSSSPTTIDDVDSAELIAAALTHLVSEDHTYGEGPPPFSEYLIEESTVVIDDAPMEEDAAGGSEDRTRRLTERERVAAEEAISQFGPVRWIMDPDEWRSDDLQSEIEGSAILGAGVPYLDGEGALVPVSLWCGGDCGTWLTYRLHEVEGEWQVTGVEGPISIS